MPKVLLTKIAEEYETPFDEALMLAQTKLPEDQVTGKGKRTWIGEQGQAIIGATLMIDEITTKHYKGIVKHEAPNPRFVYVYHKEIKKKVPVLIPRKLSGSLVNKEIMFEAIEDDKGISYRYVKPKRNT